MNETEFGLFYINYHSRLPIVSAKTGTREGALTGDYAGSSRYIVEYPEDIHLFGASFNTMLQRSGVALKGECTYRPNMPLSKRGERTIFIIRQSLLKNFLHFLIPESFLCENHLLLSFPLIATY